MKKRTHENSENLPPKRKIKRLRLHSNDEDVGYGKPPRAHQFKPGQSGNPNGRPRGRKNEAIMLDELLFKKIVAREGGRERRITVIEAIFRRFAEDSLRGNIKAAGFLLSRLTALSSGQPVQTELNDDDHAVLKAYAENILSKNKPGNR